MKKILSFDIDNTLNEPKMPIFPEMAELLATLSQKYIIAPISGQKYDQFLIQIINNLPESANLDNFHLFVAQGTQYYAHKAARLASNFYVQSDHSASDLCQLNAKTT